MAKITTNTRVARVDMTPMVDLGFLLITFFMFTTTFSLPKVMKLNLPDKITDNSIPPPMKEKNTLSLILGANNQLFWHQKNYKDLHESLLYEVAFGNELRSLIINKRKLASNPEIFTVLVHPTSDSNYKNYVDILDDIHIVNQDRYMVADISPIEKQVYEAKMK